MILSPRGHVAVSGDILVVRTGRRGVTGMKWVKTSGAINTGQLPHQGIMWLRAHQGGHRGDLL